LIVAVYFLMISRRKDSDTGTPLANIFGQPSSVFDLAKDKPIADVIGPRG
jgi:hypothetical protein